ncbi:MAG: c-type cytochrome [Opitutales bacterium]
MKFHVAPLLLLSLTACASLAWTGEPKANWKGLCAECHGEDGRGQNKMGRKLNIPDLSNKAVQGLFTDEQAFKIIKEGLTDENNKVSMKPVEGLSDTEIKSLVTFVRTLRK